MITPETIFSLPLIALLCTVSAVFIAGWKIANAVRDLTDQVRGLRGDVRAAWTRAEHERWAFELERQNHTLPLRVPAVPVHHSDLADA
jgi:hypothetical protein